MFPPFEFTIFLGNALSFEVHMNKFRIVDKNHFRRQLQFAAQRSTLCSLAFCETGSGRLLEDL